MKMENKEKFALWIRPQTMRDVDSHYKGDNCKSKSEFIEKAVKFYLGYLNEESNISYISPMITETVKSQIKGTEQRLARLMFKTAVELSKNSHILASLSDIDDDTLYALNHRCVDEVRKINGIIDFQYVNDFQHGIID